MRVSRLLPVLMTVTAWIAIPAPALGDGPQPAANTNASRYLQKPLTFVRSTTSAAEKQAVQAAFDQAQRQFVKDNDEKRLTQTPPGFSRDAGRLYRARARDYLTAKKKPEVAAMQGRGATTAAAVYALISGVITGYVEVNCKVSWTVDFVMKNRGPAAPPPPTSSTQPLFLDWNGNDWNWPANVL